MLKLEGNRNWGAKEGKNDALTANQYGNEFVAGHDCEMRPDTHCMCRDGSAISALSVRSVR